MKRLARDLPPPGLEKLAIELGAESFQARALVEWVWQKGLRSFAEATNLPKSLRQALSESVELRAARIVERSRSGDGTCKLLLALRDDETIEIVLIPEGGRTTLCLSTQVGCPVGCIFCASGLAGVRRNLKAAEIVEQFVIARAELGGRALTNLVVMGLGEPMLNLAPLERALAALSDPGGFAFSARRITVSTSGYPDRIRQLAGGGRPYQLAVSLHAADPELRRQLVPTATAAPEELVHAAQDYRRKTGREPTFEIVLLRGINDGPEHARALARLLRGVRCTVNLIPWNRVEGVPPGLATPSRPSVHAFRARLEAAGLKVTWRMRRGADKDAACGQLRLRKLGER